MRNTQFNKRLKRVLLNRFKYFRSYINIDFFLFKICLKLFILKLFSFNSFLIINLKNRIIITNNVFNKNDKFLNIDVLLLLYLYRLNINNILSLNISRIILYLFIYNFSKIKSYNFNEVIKIK